MMKKTNNDVIWNAAVKRCQTTQGQIAHVYVQCPSIPPTTATKNVKMWHEEFLDTKQCDLQARGLWLLRRRDVHANKEDTGVFHLKCTTEMHGSRRGGLSCLEIDWFEGNEHVAQQIKLRTQSQFSIADCTSLISAYDVSRLQLDNKSYIDIVVDRGISGKKFAIRTFQFCMDSVDSVDAIIAKELTLQPASSKLITILSLHPATIKMLPQGFQDTIKSCAITPTTFMDELPDWAYDACRDYDNTKYEEEADRHKDDFEPTTPADFAALFFNNDYSKEHLKSFVANFFNGNQQDIDPVFKVF